MTRENKVNPSTPAKIQRPRLERVYNRKRLFRLLDNALKRPLTWIAAAAGAGKTSLVSSYLEARQLRHLWYRIDARDSDPATFFYYLRRAVERASPSSRDTLPSLTPEYQLGVQVFARNFFEQVWAHLSAPTILVIDNYQDVPESAPLHDFLAEAIANLPEGMNILCISRVEAPSVFARVRSAQQLARIDSESLDLHVEEATQIARLSSAIEHTDQQIEQLNMRAHGWAAGLILLLERADESGTDMIAKVDEDVFSYFAAEIMRQSKPEVQAFLRQSALLPVMDVPSTAALTGNSRADEILSDLARRNYFITRRHGATPSYEFHPLFREFLLSDLRREAGASDLSNLQRRAGTILAQTGEYDTAVTLLQSAGDYESLSTLVLEQASDLVAHGRHQTLTRWLEAIPESCRTKYPWLEFWLGNCRLAYDPTQARVHLERSYEIFHDQDDVAGQYLAWAGVIDTFIYEWGDFSPMDRWVSELEHLRARHPKYPSPDIEARVVMGMVGAVTWRFPCHPDASDWAERAMRIVVGNAGSRLAMLVGNQLVFYHLWDGQFPKAAAVVEVLRPSAPNIDHDPLALLHWHAMDAMYSFCAADHHRCMAAIEAGNRVASQSGVRLLDILLNAQGVYTAVSIGDRKTARACVQRVVEGLPDRLLDKSLCHYMLASVAWLEGDFQLAIEHGETAVQLAEATHSTIGLGLCEMELAVTLFDANRIDEAATYLTRAQQSSRGRQFMEFLCDIHQARFSLEQENQAAAVKHLHRALRVGAEQGYVNIPRWQPAIMSQLCALALEYDIEQVYVTRLIELRGLPPPNSGSDHWPWPVRIYTLGRFSLVIDGVPSVTEGKTQKKPLELLKALIALGGHDISEARLSDLLWPDADADRARQSFKSALHRLRNLIGTETVLVHDGCVSLDTRNIWVDMWAIESLINEAMTALHAGDSVVTYEITQRALDLYQGAFLMAEDFSFVLVPRERLRDQILGLINELAQGLCNRKACDESVELYHAGLEIDPLTESYYQGLIQCYRCLKQPSEAMKIYNRCRNILKHELGLEPSTQTESLIKALRP